MDSAVNGGQYEVRHADDALGLLIDGATNYAIYMLDPSGRVTIWNRGAERIKGWKEAEVIGRSAEIFYRPEAIGAGQLRDELERARRFGKIEEESWRVRKDGSCFRANATITALYGPAGELRGFGKVVRDITEQLEANAELAYREARLASILATVPEAMALLDQQGRILLFSKTAEKLFGYSEGAIAGLPANTLLVNGDSFLPPVDSASSTVGRRLTGLRADGTTFPFELALGVLTTETTVEFTAFMRDLTDREETEAQLERLQSELSQVAHASALGVMGSTLAHELNQPITAVVNYAEAARTLLARGGDPSHIAEALEYAVAEALRAGGIVRQLRSFIARGEVEKQSCDLPTLIHETHRIASGLLRDQNVVTAYDLEASAPVMVERIQIQQVLLNLIRNAADAMADVERRVLFIRTRSSGSTVQVTVADTGQGIPTELADTLFNAFVSGKTSGMGVGLSICRTIIEAHGCRIWADRTSGGARVHFTLPLLEQCHAGA